MTFPNLRAYHILTNTPAGICRLPPLHLGKAEHKDHDQAEVSSWCLKQASRYSYLNTQYVKAMVSSMIAKRIFGFECGDSSWSLPSAFSQLHHQRSRLRTTNLSAEKQLIRRVLVSVCWVSTPQPKPPVTGSHSLLNNKLQCPIWLWNVWAIFFLQEPLKTSSAGSPVGLL